MGRVGPIFGAITGALVATSLLLTGCGYQFRADGKPVGISIESLAIPLFTSTSSEIGFEADFTRVIRNEFVSHARVPLVPVELADKVIIGRIHDVRTVPLTYDTRQLTVNNQATTYEVTRIINLRVFLDVRLVDKESGTVIWQEPSLTDSTSFAVDPDPLVTQYNQKQALEFIARRIAKDIYLKTMERF